MKGMNSSIDPRLVAAARVPACVKPSERHAVYPVDLLCLVTGGMGLLERGPDRRHLEENALLLVRAGESHILRRRPRCRTEFWLLFFEASGRLYDQLPVLGEPDPNKRIWKLADDQAASFRELFLKLTVERANRRPEASQAEAGWLSLLLVFVQRWGAPPNGHIGKISPLLPGTFEGETPGSLPKPPGFAAESAEAKQPTLDSDVLRRRIRFLGSNS